MNVNNWKEAAKHFHVVSYNFPHTSYGQDAFYYLGIANYYLQEYEFANENFNQYLKCQSNPRFFQEAIEYKFYVAEQFRGGAKRHYFGTKQLPKWADGKSMALDIYDEVVAAMPSHEMAAQALFAKGCLLCKLREHRDSIDAFQMVIRRFPKHELSPESYILINKIYLVLSRKEYQNSDLLALAEINLRRFKSDFPREERIAESEADVLAIKEIYAKGLYETGQFYEKCQRPNASVLYYQKAMVDFPDTSIAQKCRNRLSRLCPSALEVQRPQENETFDLDDNFDLEEESQTISCS